MKTWKMIYENENYERRMVIYSSIVSYIHRRNFFHSTEKNINIIKFAEH